MRCPNCQAENDDAAEVCFHCRAVLSAVTQGTVIASRYRILAPLGRGGMGAVYRARDEVLDEEVALKILRPEVAGTREMAARFRSEIKLARRVSHWNVCRIHEYGEDGGLQYISMELIGGGTLKDRLRTGPLPAAEALGVAVQMAEGLAAIHKVGIVHRDLKSANVMIAADGTVKVMDFGIAKPVSAGTDGGSTGYVLGSPEYMSPEQARGRRADFRSDIYSLGIVVFEACTGRVPFRGPTPVATLMMHVEAPPPIDDPALSLPPAIVRVLRRALAKDPGDRFPDAAAMVAALRAARGDAATDAGESPSPPLQGAAASFPDTEVVRTRRLPMLRRWSDRSRHALLASAVGTVAVAAGIAGLLASRRARSEASAPVASAAPITSASPSAPAAARSSSARGSPLAALPAVRPSPTVFTPPPPRATTATPVLSPPSLTTTTTVPSSDAMVSPSMAASPTASPATTTSAGPTSATTTPAGAPSPAEGRLLVLARPWAEVSVDGHVLFTTPMKPYALAPGSHALVLTHPKYRPYIVRVEIRPGELTTINVDLAAERR